MRTKKLKCRDCPDYLEINLDVEFVHINLEVVKWSYWSKIKYAFGLIFSPREHSGGAIIWCKRTDWEKFVRDTIRR